MAGPWDKYASAAPAASAGGGAEQGPWAKYGSAAPAAAAAPAQGADSGPDGLLKAEDHPFLKGATDLLPAIGGIAGGLTGAVGGSVVPGAGTVAGEVGGAAVGQAAGSVAKDAINNWIFGGNKSAGDIAKDAGIEGALGGAFQGAGAALGAGGKALAATGIGKAALETVGNVAAKTGEAIFRVPSEVIKRYATAGEQIAKMSADADGSVAAASDTVKQGMLDSLKEFRGQANEQIGKALEASDKMIDADPILAKLTKAKEALDPALQGDQIKHIEDMIAQVHAVAGETAEIPVARANTLKQTFQSLTDYDATTAVGDRAKAAAKDAAATARQLINEAVPEVATANNQLAQLHNIQNNMVKSILKPGAAESGLVAAGKGANERNLLVLEKLSKLTGQDLVGPAQNLAAMKEFGATSLKKTGALAAVGAAVGGAADGEHGAIVGGTLGAAVSSPALLKGAIRSAQMASKVVPSAVSNNALGQTVLRGSGAVNAIRQNQP